MFRKPFDPSVTSPIFQYIAVALWFVSFFAAAMVVFSI